MNSIEIPCNLIALAITRTGKTWLENGKWSGYTAGTGRNNVENALAEVPDSTTHGQSTIDEGTLTQWTHQQTGEGHKSLR